MGYIQQVQRGIDYIEDNLSSDVEIPLVAKQAAMSQWHFQRIFKATTGETLKMYIRSRRLSVSLQRLLFTDDRIIDIAMDSGFESQESYSRAILKLYGMTPGQFRKTGNKNQFPAKAKIDKAYIDNLHSGVSLSPSIVSVGKRHFVGVKTTYYGADSDKNNFSEKIPGLWSGFQSKLPTVPNAIHGTAYGIIRQTAADSELLEYYAAVEVTDLSEVPEGMSSISLNAGKYAAFTHAGAPALLDHTVNYIYSNWLFGTDLRHTFDCDIEVYGKEYNPASESSSMEYWVPVAGAD